MAHARKVDELEERIDELQTEIEELQWSQEDAQALADSVRRTHDGEHSQAWRWCDEDTCRLVREHELDG